MSRGVDANDGREAILRRIRRAIGRGSADDQARARVAARLAHSEPALIPARADLAREDRIRLFIEQATAVQATVERISSHANLAETIAAYLRRHNLPMRLVKAADAELAKAAWDKGLLQVRDGRPREDDQVGVTTAVAGIAETGTLMLTSDRDHPTMLAFLPETAIVTLSSGKIVRAYEDAFRAHRDAGRDLPRSVNLITGPSRSGDIEQTLQLGAHGPKRLLVILVDDADDPPQPTIAAMPSAV